MACPAYDRQRMGVVALNQPTPVAPGGCALAWSSGAFFIVELPERGLSDTWQLLTVKLQMAM